MNRLKLIMCVALVPLFVACSQTPSSAVPTNAPVAAPVKLTIEAKEFAFVPDKSTVQVGQTVEVVMKNAGSVAHDFTIEKIALKDKAISHGDSHEMGESNGMHEDELAVHVAAEGGHTGTVTFIPSEPGQYEFYCTVAGHKVSGMVGKLTVVAP
jgi:uncharacterized cupredoxin-like copper-binding protein